MGVSNISTKTARNIGVSLALFLTACGVEESRTEVETSGHTADVTLAPNDECQTTDRNDEQLEAYVHDFFDSYHQHGTSDLPIDILDRVLVLTKLPYEQMKDEDRRRNGVLQRVTCLNKITAYKIYVADPETVPTGHALKNEMLFKETVFHELGHIFYGHYDGDESTVTTKHGLMAARKDVKDTTEEAHETRIQSFFGNAKYKAHLPKNFFVQYEDQQVDPRTVD